MEKAGVEYDEEEKAYLVEQLSSETTIDRPAAPKIDPKKDNLIFMQLDLDYCTETPPTSLGMGNDKTTIVRMFGVTKDQNSVMAHIYNFRPYFYARCIRKYLLSQ